MDPLKLELRSIEFQKLTFFIHWSVSEFLENQQDAVLELTPLLAVFDLNRTIWRDFNAFLWFILPGANFLVTSYILLSWNELNLLLNHTYAYRMCGIDSYSMLLSHLLTKLEGQVPLAKNCWFMNFFNCKCIHITQFVL